MASRTPCHPTKSTESRAAGIPEAIEAVTYVVPIDEMRRFAVAVMARVGVAEAEAGQLADLLISADLRGHYSHGLQRLHIYAEDIASGTTKPGGQPKVLKQKGATAWVDGDNALGVVVGNFCTELAAELAREHGVGWVIARYSNHFGITGYYSGKMAREYGLIGFAFTNASPIVFPTRSIEVGLGTNPISCVARAQKPMDEFALDMAGTTVALGKVEWARRQGKPIPSTWIADSEGQPTTDDDAVLSAEGGGALLPLGGTEETGGYKGFGLIMMVELLCGILGGGAFGKNVRVWRDISDRPADLGQCFIAVDPECFAPGFPDRLQQFLDETRSLKPADPTRPVMVAGDIERLHQAASEQAGGILYPTIAHLEKVAEQRDVPLFSYSRVEGNLLPSM